MVRKPDIQYIQQFYVYGSEARVVETKPVKKKPRTVLPKAKSQVQQVTKIYVDPVALCGLIVASVMLVVMVVGLLQFREASQANTAMENYVTALQEKNEELTAQYQELYDLERVREKALAIGMVPAEENPPIALSVTIPEPEPEPTIWEDFLWFLEGLFA